MPVTFELKSQSNLLLDVRNLNPDSVAGLSVQEIGRIEIGLGNRKSTVAQWFDVVGMSDDREVIFKGTLENVLSIGHSLNGGRITIDGTAGRHVGASMSAGEIVVHGDVGDYLGYEMQGGTIVVHGSAGDHVGGCYPGARFGMNRGSILIAGSAGKGLGHRMRRGTIVVGGDVGDHAGWQMRAGTIFICGSCSGSVGIDMKRGMIVMARGCDFQSPTFSRGLVANSWVIGNLSQWLGKLATRHALPLPLPVGPLFQSWHGDSLAGGRGEVFTAVEEAD